MPQNVKSALDAKLTINIPRTTAFTAQCILKEKEVNTLKRPPFRCSSSGLMLIKKHVSCHCDKDLVQVVIYLNF